MNILKKLLGFLWLAGGIAGIGYLPFHAAQKIAEGKQEDIVFWSIMVFIFIPILLGFSLFGWYAIKGEYEEL
ncbi:hypothetical protein QNI19_07685 [Cytophagaceae bacterium DM2B3-1]|uniref:Uncharacterized protein n=1 Tax=Xanthocytophaga flava TaxID=3048013 RepID=A0AAE3QL34_9BACT|nr:hypothetical protein [Xanthocytophaga flavus]MDJ1472025.1 hypothetical protein [Xanthocytophaga flavus]MDJ1479465.1 hypothetical protein [Xanthocytophaga flavus]MDJ1492809.1 hypothetical protein [Xanthocytophaga flavus]